MGVGLDLFGGLVCVTSVEKDKFPTENFPEIKGSHREISGGKYTTERKETSSCPNPENAEDVCYSELRD